MNVVTIAISLNGISCPRFWMYRKYWNEPVDTESSYLTEIFRKEAENIKEEQNGPPRK